MSDTVTNVEIEDVLSSIRRLVAEGDRSRHTAALARVTAEGRLAEPVQGKPAGGPVVRANSADGSGERNGKFVLTPALRVAGDVEDTSGPGFDGVNSPAGEDAPFINVEDTGDQPATSGPDNVFRTLRADIVMPMQPRDWSRLEATITELEAAVTRRSDDWEPDGSEISPVMGWHKAAGSDATSVADIAAGTDTGAPTERMLRDGVPTEPVVGTEGGSAFAYAEVSFQHKRLVDAARLSVVDLAGDALPRTAAANDSPCAIPVDPAEGAADGRNEEASIDKDLLRELVVEVIRQELQGELGEKITRNVRKLVRREIYRVLASQTLD